MRTALLLLLAIISLSILGCSTTDAYDVSSSQDVVSEDDASLEDVFVQEAEEQFISDEPFIELGEMI